MYKIMLFVCLLISKISYAQTAPLLDAVTSGDYETVSQLLNKEDIDVNKQDNIYGNTALIEASANGYIGIVKLLLDHPEIDINVQNTDGINALMVAVINRHTDIALELIQKDDIDFNAISSTGNTALMFVSSLGNITVADMLLQYIDINLILKNKNNDTALGLASYSKIISGIIEHRNFDLSNVDFQIDNFVSIIQNNNILAMERLIAHPDLTFSEQALNMAFALLLKHGYEGMLEAFMNYKGNEILTNIPDEKIEKLIDTSTNPEGDFEPLLKWAIAQDHIEFLEILFMLDKSLTKNLLGANNSTPLIWASAGGYIDIVKYLVSILPISEINVQDDTGSSALIAAIINDEPEVVDFLLDIEGLDVSIKDKIGYTALIWATLTDKPLLVSRFMKQNSFEPLDIFTSLMLASEKGDLYITNTILQNADIGPVLEYANILETPLMKAAQNNYYRLVRHIISFGFDINQQDSMGNTSLHLAVKNNSNKAALALLSYRNIDVNIQNFTTGATALILAIKQNNKILMLSILRRSDIDVSIEDNDGKTALDYATELQYSDIVKILKAR